MPITPPSNLSYGTVVWRVGSMTNDTSDVDDLPDLIVPEGTVVNLMPTVSHLVDGGATPSPITLLAASGFTGVIDSDGYLCNVLEDGSQGVRGVKVIATDDADLNPTGWLYQVTYRVRSQQIKSHLLAVPAGGTVDLSTAIPPAESQPIGLPQAEAAAAAAAAAALAAAASAEVAADALTDLDPTITGIGEDDTSDFSAFLTAKILGGLRSYSFTGYVDPEDDEILRLTYLDVSATVHYDTSYPLHYPAPDPDSAPERTISAVLLGPDGIIPADLLPASSGGGGGGPVTGTARALASLGTGLAVPSWGRAPGFTKILGEAHFSGQLIPAATDLIVGTVLLAGGSWTTGIKATADTDTGTLLIRSTATTLEIDQILSGSAPTWVSLDGVIV